MKTIITTLLLLLAVAVNAQYKQTLNEEIAFEQPGNNNVFYLANINGSIKVETYNGDKIMLEAREEIKAKTDARLQRAKEELSLGIIDRLDTIIVYIKGPCEKFTPNNNRYGKMKSGWCYDWNHCDKYEYDYSFDFTLKVPANMNLYLSTINKGDITVADVRGTLNIHNINGAISLDGVVAQASAHTINGDVKINYTQLPNTGKSSFYTLNGDIEANYPAGLKADLSFKSYNGDFYTNIDAIDYRPNVLASKENSNENGIAFKVDTKSIIRVRGGGPLTDFETFNGDVYVKEK